RRPASADVDDPLGLVDIAVAPEALQSFASLGTEARRIACLDTDDPARIATLADDFVQVPVHHEPDARLAGGVFNGARNDVAAAYAARSAPGVSRCAGGTAGLGVEGRLYFLRQVAVVFLGCRSRLDVRFGSWL